MADPHPIERARNLEDVRRRLAQWRETRTHRGAPMPAALWTAAVGLARRYGLGPTTRALHVDYGTLKARLEAARGAAPTPAFVELTAARQAGVGACVIEVAGRRGRRLRVEVSSLPVSDLVALAQGLWIHAR